MLFQGEEWAATSPFQYFADHEDPELARQVSEGRRREFAAFGWDPASIPDPEKQETFLRSKLRWNEVSESPHAEMLAWYRQLIALRNSTPSLNDGEAGNTVVSFSEEQRWLTMRRGGILVVFSVSTTDQSLPIPASAELLLASHHGVRIESGSVTLPSESVAILRI
jgi:maltooligosyltrehalose trehalohydrolase